MRIDGLAHSNETIHVPIMFQTPSGLSYMRGGRAVVGGLGMIAVGMVSGLAGAAGSRHFGTSNYTISYADFISILLTAISLMVGLLAIMIAIAAYVGWTSLSSKVASDVKSYLNEGFKDGNPLHVMVRSELRAEKNKVMYEGVVQVDTEFDADAEAEGRGE